MSHYLDFKTLITDPVALVKALGHMNNARHKLITEDMIELNDQAVSLYGYQGDERSQKANVIIRRQHVGGSSNDIGFVKKADGTYATIISEFDSTHYNENWQTQLYTYYNFEKAKIECTKKGMNLTEEKTADGRLVLRARFKQQKTDSINI